MEFHDLLLRCCCVMVLFTLYRHGFAQDDPSIGYTQAEKNALYALKNSFNNSVLNKSWIYQPCFAQSLSKWIGIRCVNGRVSQILLKDMELTGSVSSDAFAAFAELTVLSLKGNSLSGNVMNFSLNSLMKQIDLSRNNFDGTISPSWLSLSNLEALQLQDNRLTGQIPAFNQSSLVVFNVSNNSLTGVIPQTAKLLSFEASSYAGNPGLCGRPAKKVCRFNAGDEAGTENGSSGSHKTSKFPIVFGVIDFIGLVFVFLLLVLFIRKYLMYKMLVRKETEEKDEDSYNYPYGIKDEKSMTSSENIIPSSEAQQEPIAVAVDNKKGSFVSSEEDEQCSLMFLEDERYFEFSLIDLLKAPAVGLGRGMFGSTYKATMDGRPAVVVKRLRDLKPLSNEDFRKEMDVIAELKHPNLLPLLAYYFSKEVKLLVYKFAEKGSLFNHIHGGRGKERIPFRWSARLSVARGVARALEYLHISKKYESLVPHGNLKSSNVLIDENDMVLVSDFAFNSLISHPTAAQHMVAYKSPEYQAAKRLSKKSDVWSYGCLLLELLTGRIASQTAPPGIKGVDLLSWVQRGIREEWTAEIFDREISGQRSSVPGMMKLLQIAIRCSDKSPENRPEMMEVVREVENIKIVESESEDDLSVDRSLTDESTSTTSALTSYER